MPRDKGRSYSFIRGRVNDFEMNVGRGIEMMWRIYNTVL